MRRRKVIGDGLGQVRTLEELTEKYGFAPADEVAGPRNSRLFLDYGPPVILSDSSRPPRRTEEQERLWGRALGRPVGDAGKAGFSVKLGRWRLRVS